jgi:hypothetical protein
MEPKSRCHIKSLFDLLMVTPWDRKYADYPYYQSGIIIVAAVFVLFVAVAASQAGNIKDLPGEVIAQCVLVTFLLSCGPVIASRVYTKRRRAVVAHGTLVVATVHQKTVTPRGMFRKLRAQYQIGGRIYDTISMVHPSLADKLHVGNAIRIYVLAERPDCWVYIGESRHDH